MCGSKLPTLKSLFDGVGDKPSSLRRFAAGDDRPSRREISVECRNRHIEPFATSFAVMAGSFSNAIAAATSSSVNDFGQPLRPNDFEEPSVSLLLLVDEIYRDRAAAGLLRRIAPKRFNPESDAWLPVLHHEKEGWIFTALFSNTELAHRLDRTDDWVVVYFHRDHGPEHQRTIVTETRGPLQALRVVRGREPECRRHYLAA